MRCQTLSSLSFFCGSTFVVWKTKLRKRSDFCGLPTLSSGISVNGFTVQVANKCADEDANASRQLAVHSPVHMS